MREVFTVSLGGHANFANAHFWNFQDELAACHTGELEEVDHGLLFRAGETRSGVETMTPRVVVVEAKGGLGGLPQQGWLYGENQVGAGGYTAQMAAAAVNMSLWSGEVQTLAQAPVPQNTYMVSLSAADTLSRELAAESAELEDGSEDESEEQEPPLQGPPPTLPPTPAEADAAADEWADAVATELQTSVHFWSDFLKVHVHPRTMHTLQRTTRFDDFDCYSAGVEAYKHDAALENATDACRHFLEECDLLQGFHILADTDTAWGGVAVELLEYMRDDYPRTPILTFATEARGGLPVGREQAESAADEHRASIEGVERCVPASVFVGALRAWRSSHRPPVRRRKPLNSAVCMAELANYSTLILPMNAVGFVSGLGGVRMPSLSDFNSSAIAATALEVCTLPYRLMQHREGRMREVTKSQTDPNQFDIPIHQHSTDTPLPEFTTWCGCVWAADGRAYRKLTSPWDPARCDGRGRAP